MRAHSRARNAWGIWIRIPAPSPVLTSHPQAPRCSKFLSTVRAWLTIAWDLRPLMSTTNPTPQASCSWAGSYRPCAAGSPGVIVDIAFPFPLSRHEGQSINQPETVEKYYRTWEGSVHRGAAL